MNNNEWLDIDVLEDYLDGKLDAKTMHRVERISLEDPFVAEALAGLSASPKRVQSLSLLQKQLQDRITQKPVQEKRWQITSQRLSIAAAAAVLFVTVSLLFWMRESSNREKLAANMPKKVEVAIAAKKESEKPIVKTKDEITKVIAETSQPSYANNSKKVAQPKKPTISPLVATAPAMPIERANEDVVSLKAKKEVSSVLAGKVSGIQIHKDYVQGAVYGEDGLPVSGAMVKFKGAAKGAITDGKGQFSLSLDSIKREAKLDVTSIGFMPKEVSVKKNENLAIQLKQNNDSLSEVVITGYGTAQKKMSVASSMVLVKTAEPEGGWDKFEAYMVNSNKLLVDKKLTNRTILVNFKVNSKGEPTAIKLGDNANLVPPPTKAEEKEAIRLLKEGPKWLIPENSKPSVRQTSVNIRF